MQLLEDLEKNNDSSRQNFVKRQNEFFSSHADNTRQQKHINLFYKKMTNQYIHISGTTLWPLPGE